MTTDKLQNTKKAVLDKIKSSDNFLILISDPDGDEASAGIAMHEILTQMGKESTLFSHFNINDFFYLPGNKNYRVGDLTKLNFGQFDIIITVDTPEEYRLIDKKNRTYHSFKLPKDKFIINIDHHPHSNSYYGDINYVPENISSTGEALYDIFKDEIKITPSIATNILNSLIADTQCFRQTDVTHPKTLRIAADLIEKGADHFLLTLHIYYNFSFNDVKAYANVLKELELRKAGKYTYAQVVIDEKKLKIDTLFDEFTSIINERIRSISDCNFSVNVAVLDPTTTRFSLRARDTEVLKIAKHLGGGGHKRAAGATVKKDLETSLKMLGKYIEKAKLPEIKMNEPCITINKQKSCN